MKQIYDVIVVSICKKLKGAATGVPLCPCPECVRNAVLALGDVLPDAVKEIGKYIAVCLNQTTFLTRESTITLGISTLSGTHDRTLGCIKVV